MSDPHRTDRLPEVTDRRQSDDGPPGKKERRRTRRLARRHPDIEIARLLVKRGFVEKPEAVECLKIQKQRAKQGKKRIPFLQLLVKRDVLSEKFLDSVQDEIRRHTYLCDYCDARAVILAGSQSRAGACPRCGHEISIEAPTDPELVPVKDFRPRTGQTSQGESAGSGTMTWRPLGSRSMQGLTLGEVAFGRYLLEEELGRGAMGIVYRAKHLDLDKDIALKVLMPTEEGFEHQVARFRREAAAVQKLQHEGIVQVHDFGSDHEVYYLTMDLVEGGDSLHRRLKRKEEPPSLRYRLDVVRQVARAVGHAHQRGVIHRDLKPANVLLAKDGSALVADFGLAKDEDAEAAELTRTQDRLGTPLFMAPEQIRRGAAQVDGRADVWALGVMLFVCVTGRYPFRSRTVMDLYLRIMREEPDWTGHKYSAPDRGGMRLKRSKKKEEPSGSDAASGPPSTVAEPGERTEVGARTESGNLPKTLPEDDPNHELKAPPPFTLPPELEGKGVPSELKAIISGALAKDPEDRYPTADELAADLDRYLQGEKVRGGGPKLLKRIRQQLWRRRVLRPLALTSGILALVSMVAVGILYWRQSQLEEQLDKGGGGGGGGAVADDYVARVDRVWTKAVEADTNQGYQAAIAQLTELQKEREAAPRPFLRRAQAKLRLRDLKAARVDLEQAQGRAEEQPAELATVCEVRGRLELMDAKPRAAFAAAQRGLKALEALQRRGEGSRLTATLVRGAFAGGDPVALKEAEAACAALVNAGKASPRVHAYYARLAMQRGDLKQAKARIEAALANDPNKQTPHMETLFAVAALKLAQGEPAVREFLAAHDAFPKQADPEVQYLQDVGGTLHKARRWEELLRVNAMNSRLAPWCHQLHYYMGNVLQNRLSKASEALVEFRKAVRINPYHLFSRDFYLAGLLARKRKGDLLEEAAAFLSREEELLRPQSPDPALRLAYVRIRQGRLLDAWQALERSDARREPAERGKRTALARAAIMRLAEGGDQVALSKLKSFPQVSADDLEGTYGSRDPLYRAIDHLEMGRIYVEASLSEHAKHHLDAALGQHLPGNLYRREQLIKGVALVQLARTLANQGKFGPALENLTAAAKGYTKAPEITPDLLPTFPEFKTLRTTPDFKQIIALQQKRDEFRDQ